MLSKFILSFLNRHDKSNGVGRKKINIAMPLLLFFLPIIIALPIFQYDNVSAITKAADKNVDFDWQIQSFYYRRLIAYCLENSNLSTPQAYTNGNGIITASDAMAGKWFGSGGEIKAGVYLSGILKESSDTTIKCSDPNLVSNALSLWGLNAIDVICNSGFMRLNYPEDTSQGYCLQGRTSTVFSLIVTKGNNTSVNEDYSNSKAASVSKFKSYIDSQIYNNNSNPLLTPSQAYILYRNSVNNSCIKTINSAPPSDGYINNPGADVYNSVVWVDLNSPNTASMKTGYYYGDMTKTSTVELGPLFGSVTCQQLVDKMSGQASAYIDFAKANPSITIITTTKEDSQPTTTDSCAVKTIGWIVCPVINFLAGIADTAFNFLTDNFLSVNTSLLNTDPKATDSSGNAIGTGAYTAWQMMRSFANVVLVIVFLVIIVSQLTSVGITNYGIKKLLPKLVLVAVLINISFFICQISVDLSNILGYSLKSLLTNLAGSAVNIPAAAASATGSGWSGIAGKVLAGGSTAVLGVAWAGGIPAAFVALVGMVLAAVIALVMIFFILVVRQMLVVLLVVMAPLAFAAYLLPNTKNWFDKWRKLFTQILMLFPVIGLIFGGSTLVSVILKSAFAGSGSILAQIVAAGVLALPLFLVPSVLKGALNGIGDIGAKISGLGSQWGSAVNMGLRNKYASSDYNKFNQAKKADNKARIAAGNYRGRGGWINPRNIRSRVNARLNDSRAFNRVTGGFGASQFLSSQGQDRKDMADTISMFGGDDDLIEAWADTGGDINDARTWTGANGQTLNNTQVQQMQRMRDAGLHRKATSFLAAASAMSTGGKGSTAAIASALGNAARAGASATDTDGAWQSSLAAYRTSGRGDIVGEMSAHMTANGGVTPLGIGRLTATPAAIAVSRLTSWGQVSASSVHRNAIDPAINPAGAMSYQTFLNGDAENTRQALAGYDQMEARAKVHAQPDIITAAQIHESHATGVASTITNIQDAKTYFGIR